MVELPQLVTELPGPRSRELHARRTAAVPAGFGLVLDVFLEGAGEDFLIDVDGNRLIDFATGIAVTGLGAANPVIAEAVARQAQRLLHSCFMVTEYEGFVRVAEWLNTHAPIQGPARTALFSTGAEAVENAVKIARAATGRPGVLVVDEGYHGRSLLTLSMTAKPHPYKTSFGPFVDEVVRVPNANPLRTEGTAAALAALEQTLAEDDPDRFAALVVEPIQGEGGFVVPAPGYLAGLRELTARHGIALVIDEIQTGLGRTGRLFALDHEPGELRADLVLTAKALGGGLPLAAVTGRAELMDAVHPGGLGGTYAGNPVACAAALAVFAQLERPGFLDRVLGIERQLRDRLLPLVQSQAEVIELRGRGAMMALEFADPDAGLSPRADLAGAISARCHQAGVLTLTCGSHSNVIRLLPPLVIRPDVLDRGLDLLIEAIRAETTET